MKAEKKRCPEQAATRIPTVLELFFYGRELTASQLAVGFGMPLGADAVTRCRQAGLPLRLVGKLPDKLYAVDLPALWRTLEEAIGQIDRYLLLLQRSGLLKNRHTFRTAAKWMQHVRRVGKLEPQKPSGKHGSLHKTRAAPRG
jgi:hypothetical protein